MDSEQTAQTGRIKHSWADTLARLTKGAKKRQRAREQDITEGNHRDRGGRGQPGGGGSRGRGRGRPRAQRGRGHGRRRQAGRGHGGGGGGGGGGAAQQGGQEGQTEGDAAPASDPNARHRECPFFPP